jgi:pimeloyl-ACP methyl ester carboxylesterase
MFTGHRARIRFAGCLAGMLLVAACTTPTPTAAPTATASPTKQTASASPASTATAPSGQAVSALEGAWEGSIKVAGQDIGMVVRFTGTGTAANGVMDIPAQSARDIPLSKVDLSAPKVYFEAFSGQRLAVYDGKVQADGSIAGQFTQSGIVGTFALKRATAQASPTAATMPYRQEEVTVKNGTVSLAGTLTLPPAGGPFPAVVLITGSGAQNRDEEIFGFQPFRLIADHLTRNGIAVLRMDDRGVGGSTGDVEKATSEDFAGDIVAAVAMLKSRPEINPGQIGLLGHSEGGIIGPMVANRSSDVAFVILLAGPGVNGGQIVVQQVADLLKASGQPQSVIDQSVAAQKQVVRAVETGEGWDAVKAIARAQAQAQIAALPAEQRKALGDEQAAVEKAVQAQIDALNSPWYKFFITYDPAPALAKLKIPVLALLGGKDVQVSAGLNAPALQAAFAQGGNSRATVKTYPEANHLFQPATTGGIDEYSKLKTFVPGLLDDVVAWIKGAIKG